jgi:hypothetical protein
VQYFSPFRGGSGVHKEAAGEDQRKATIIQLLVHCIAGVSRSVSMVIAYLISERNMSYDEAYREVKSRRKIVHIGRNRFVPTTVSSNNSRSSTQSRKRSKGRAVLPRLHPRQMTLSASVSTRLQSRRTTTSKTLF